MSCRWPTSSRFRRRGWIGRCGSADDYRRFAGRRAKLVMREAVDGQRFFKGRLGGVEDERTCCIDADDGRRHRVPVDVITRANLEVEF